MASAKIKASDRSKVCQQIVTVLKKEYGSRLPSHDFDVLDTLLFSICLENSNRSDAEIALQRLKDNFFDYNELRVSSITEIQNAFIGMSEPEWRAMRVRDVLQYVFENGYSFEAEDLRKKTMDAAEKQLKKIKSLTPFNISHTLLFSLGSHVVPIDEGILSIGKWLGLLEPGTKVKAASEQLKGAVRKADVPLFYYLVSNLASASNVQKTTASSDGPEGGDPLKILLAVSGRLKDLLAGKIKPSRKTKPAATKKAAKATKKTTAKKTITEKTTKKTADKKLVKKASPEKEAVQTKGKAKKTAAPKKKTAKKVAKKPATTSKAGKKSAAVKKKTTAPVKKKAVKKKTATKKATKKKTTKKGRK